MSIEGLNPAEPGSNGLAGLGDDELRALKVALQACFPALDGLISNSQATGDPGDTDPPDAATFSNLFDRVAFLASVGDSGGYVPIGGIVLWSGSTDTIPTGWALCDGSTANGEVTPDLRNRFVVGAVIPAEAPASGFGVGANGGNNWQSYGNSGYLETQSTSLGTVNGTVSIPPHTIVVDNLPEHYHHMAYDNATGDTGGTAATAGKSIKANYGNSSSDGYVLTETDGVYSADEADVGRTSLAGGVAGAPNALTHDGASVTVSGIDHDHVYSPRYYALAYIMRVGS